MSVFIKAAALILILLIPNTTLASGSAFWTGKSRQVQTVTYQMAWECEYNYNGQSFTKIFQSMCPSSISVETPENNSFQQPRQSVSPYSSYTAKAYFTGRSEMVQDMNHQMVWRCEYNYNGQSITKLFQTSCPSSIDVQ